MIRAEALRIAQLGSPQFHRKPREQRQVNVPRDVQVAAGFRFDCVRNSVTKIVGIEKEKQRNRCDGDNADDSGDQDKDNFQKTGHGMYNRTSVRASVKVVSNKFKNSKAIKHGL